MVTYRKWCRRGQESSFLFQCLGAMAQVRTRTHSEGILKGAVEKMEASSKALEPATKAAFH